MICYCKYTWFESDYYHKGTFSDFKILERCQVKLGGDGHTVHSNEYIKKQRQNPCKPDTKFYSKHWIDYDKFKNELFKRQSDKWYLMNFGVFYEKHLKMIEYCDMNLRKLKLERIINEKNS